MFVWLIKAWKNLVILIGQIPLLLNNGLDSVIIGTLHQVTCMLCLKCAHISIIESFTYQLKLTLFYVQLSDSE